MIKSILIPIEASATLLKSGFSKLCYSIKKAVTPLIAPHSFIKNLAYLFAFAGLVSGQQTLVAQCTNTSQYPGATQTASVYNNIQTIVTDQWEGEFFAINLVAGSTYNIGTCVAVGGLDGDAADGSSITIYDAGMVSQGFATNATGGGVCVSFTPIATGTYTVHVDNAACTDTGTAGPSNTTAVQCTSCPPPPVPPTNDACASAIVLTLDGASDCKNTVSATSVGDPVLSCSGANNTVWYSYTPAATGIVEVQFDLPGSGEPLNGWVALYTGVCGTLTQQGVCLNLDLSTGSPKTGLTASLTGGTTYYIMVDGYSNDTGEFCISLNTPPPCLPIDPATLAVGPLGITANSADIDWAPAGTETAWDIEYGTAGFTQGTGTFVDNILTSNYNITGLAACTGYEFYLRADCGASGTSTWIGPYGFTTVCPCLSTLTSATLASPAVCSGSPVVVNLTGLVLDAADEVVLGWVLDATNAPSSLAAEGFTNFADAWMAPTLPYADNLGATFDPVAGTLTFPGFTNTSCSPVSVKIYAAIVTAPASSYTANPLCPYFELTLTVNPTVVAGTAAAPVGCTVTVTKNCPTDAMAASAPTGGALVAAFNATTGVYTAPAGALAGTLTITFSNASGCTSPTLVINTPACPVACPAATAVADGSSTICSGGLGTLVSTWQTAVATANPSGLVYSSVTPVAGTTAPDGLLPTGINAACGAITQTVMAYVYCDVNSSSTVDAGDSYTLVSTYTLTVNPSQAGLTTTPIPGSCNVAASITLSCGASIIATETGTPPTCASPSQPFSGSFTAAEIATALGVSPATCYSDIAYGPIAATCAATPTAVVSPTGTVCATGTGTSTFDLMGLIATGGDLSGTWAISGSANGTLLSGSTLDANTAVVSATVVVTYTIAATADCPLNSYSSTITIIDCSACPLPPSLTDDAATVCSGGGTATFVAWQTAVVAAVAAVDNATSDLTVEYSTTLPSPSSPATGTASITGNSSSTCGPSLQSINAYMRCDGGTPLDPLDDIWSLVGNYTLTVNPTVLAGTASAPVGCSLTVTKQCTDDVMTASAPTGGAAILNFDPATGIFTAYPGAGTGTLTITFSNASGCSSPTLVINTPSCVSNCNVTSNFKIQ